MPLKPHRPVTIVCEQPCEFNYRDGLFYITDPSTGIARAMRPTALLQTFRNAAVAIQDFHAEDGAEAEVVQLRAAG